MKILIESSDRNGITRARSSEGDNELVIAAKNGDMDAFVELCERHYTKALHCAYRITGNWDDAEDAIQDSFLRAFIHLSSFEGRSNFSSWFTRICINSSLMVLRKRHFRHEVSLDDNANDETKPLQISDPKAISPEGLCIHKEREQLIRQTMLRMQPGWPSVVELRLLQNCSNRDVSRELGISMAAAKTRWLRAKRALRKSVR